MYISGFAMEFQKVFALLALFVAVVPAPAQTAIKDTQAVALLDLVLSNAGSPVSSIRDFRASGSVTSYWAGESVPGKIDVRGIGLQRFRLDITDDVGTQTCVVRNFKGSCSSPYYQLTKIGLANSFTFKGMALPYLRLLAALEDTSVEITYVGLEKVDGKQFHRIRTRRATDVALDPERTIAKVETAEYLIDSSSSQLIGLQDNLHPERDDSANHPRSLYYSDFRSVDGVMVPFRLDEYVFGQHTRTILFSSFSTNVGLTDADFNN
jgi:hypothetical protein